MSSLKSTLSGPYVLALQGGGALGAFAGGMLATLLADPRVPLPAAISGTSAGAVNGIIVADAIATSPTPEAARQAIARHLHALWHDDVPYGGLAYMQKYLGPMVGMKHLSPPPGTFVATHQFMNIMREWCMMMHVPVPRISAADNPLLPLLRRVEFDALNAPGCPVKVYIAATDADAPTKGYIFQNGKLCPEVMAASGALPDAFAPLRAHGLNLMEGAFHHNPPLRRPVDDGFKNVVLLQLEANMSHLRPHPLEKRAYLQTARFLRPTQRDITWLECQNGVRFATIGMFPHHGWRPPSKLLLSRKHLAGLYQAGCDEAQALLATL